MSDQLQSLASGRTAPKKGFGAWIAGRSRRREYWLWIVPSILVIEGLSIAGVPGAPFFVAVPVLFAMIRRLHDLGRSGWIAPLINVGVNIVGLAARGFVPGETGSLIATLVYYGGLVVLGAIPGQRKLNEFGPPPGRKRMDVAETFA